MTKLEQIKKMLSFKRMLTFSNIVSNLPFLLFVAGLSVFYIWNTYWAQQNIRTINQTTEEIKELRWEYMTTKSELMYESKQSRVAEKVDTLGLRELRTPPKKILTAENEH